MELHDKIIEILTQEFPTLVIPDIQEGFNIAITVCLERLAPDPKNPVQYMEFSYYSETGDFTYVPFLLGSGIAHPTTVEEFQTELQWAKEHGPFKVNASVNFVCPSITVYNKTAANVDNNFTPECFTDDEIKLARERENDKFGVEVSEDKSKIKVFPKDKDSLDDPLLLTVERHIKFPKDRMWHIELLTTIPNIGTDPHNDPRNHVRWSGIPLSVMLDKIFGLFEDDEHIKAIPAAGTPR